MPVPEASRSPFRYSFDEVVRVTGDDPELASVRGQLGVVVGRGENESDPSYGIWLYSLAEVWCVAEADLEPTGRSDPRRQADYSIRVAVDEDGRGRVVGLHRRNAASEGS